MSVPQFVFAFYGEGNSDDAFFPIIIERTIQKLGIQKDVPIDPICEVIDRATLHKAHKKGLDRVLAAAQMVYGYHALILHKDADSSTQANCLTHHIAPIKAAFTTATQDICDTLLPIIPIHMMEAWMLADGDALCQQIGTALTHSELGIPPHPRLVEGLADPKGVLNAAIKTANQRKTRRRREFNVSSIYEPLARTMNLEMLGQVPAYQQFIVELERTFVKLNLF